MRFVFKIRLFSNYSLVHFHFFVCKKKIAVDESSASKQPSVADDHDHAGQQDKGRFNSDGEWEPCSDSEDEQDTETQAKRRAQNFYDLTEEEQLKLAQESKNAAKLLDGQGNLQDSELAGTGRQGDVEQIDNEPTENADDKKDGKRDGAAEVSDGARKRQKKA